MNRPDNTQGNDRKQPVRLGASAELTSRAVACLRHWRRQPDAVLECPNCGASGLEIIDRSARPMAEWYAFRCAACGLDDALQIPMPIHRSL